MSRKIVIMAGGTGGHVFPGLAVAHRLQADDWQVHWLGTPDRMEAELVPAHGFPIEFINIRGLRNHGLVRKLLAPFQIIKAILQALVILRRIKPDVVLGMGGYAAGPGGVAAKLLGIPLVLHEQNAAAGLTNRLLAKIASRPGMAYPARLSRSSGYNFINLGLSGNGKMEKEVAGMLADIDADAFILDCIPNPSPKEITERAVDFVMTLREKHPDTPIIIIQTLIRETGNFNQKARENVKQQNEAIAEQVEVLRKKGVKNLYFIKEDRFLGTDHEGTIDGTHPNDLGFDRMLKKYKPAISKILKIKFRD
jgi:UDP-N-acetylglucosamine:LPS N-acetylglucosamine transferase